MSEFTLHLVSDSTGETVGSVARATLVQFEDLEPDEHNWTLVRTDAQMQKVIDAISKKHGVVLYTIVNPKLAQKLEAACAQLGLPCVSVLSETTQQISKYLGVETEDATPGKQHELNQEYFDRVDAINFALAHDDGQMHWELEEADIILVGVSRTSKSPTSMYLAQKGYKSANVPFVIECPLPPILDELKKPLVVGLTISVERLQQIRKSRLQSLQQHEETNYIDLEHMQKEIAESRKLYNKHRWPIIDVTQRSVEETGANILQHYTKHKEKLGA